MKFVHLSLFLMLPILIQADDLLFRNTTSTDLFIWFDTDYYTEIQSRSEPIPHGYELLRDDVEERTVVPAGGTIS